MLVKHPIQNTFKVLEYRYLFTFRTIKNYLIHVKLGKTIRCFSPKMNMFRFHRCCHLKLFYSNACRIYVDIMTGQKLLLFPLLFISQFVDPVREEGMG